MATKTGDLGEQYAVEYLKKNGFNIITTHFCVRGGEIDIIASKSDTLIFIEVKTRSVYGKGKPYEAFTRTKFMRLKRAIQGYLNNNVHQCTNFRIDLVCIEYENSILNNKISHYENISLEDLK